jgi:hypothetical protein
MPFQSKAQQRYFYANKKKLEKQGVDVEEWSHETDYKNLPEKKGEFWASEYLETKTASMLGLPGPAVAAPSRFSLNPKIPVWADIGGLGVLAAPSAYELATGEEANKDVKNIAEVGGLGILAATQVPHLTGHIAH